MDLFEEKYETPQDVIRTGLESQLLRDNLIFQKAVNEMYLKLTLAEDSVVGDANENSREINSKIKQYSMMRTLLRDFILTLDGFVFKGEEKTVEESIAAEEALYSDADELFIKQNLE